MLQKTPEMHEWSWLICLLCYVDTITSTKGYNKNHTLEPFTNKLNTKVYSWQKQCSFHIFFIFFFLLEPVPTPALDITLAKSGSNLVHSHLSDILSHLAFWHDIRYYQQCFPFKISTCIISQAATPLKHFFMSGGHWAEQHAKGVCVYAGRGGGVLECNGKKRAG